MVSFEPYHKKLLFDPVKDTSNLTTEKKINESFDTNTQILIRINKTNDTDKQIEELKGKKGKHWGIKYL